MKKLFFIGVTISAIALAGCATSGNSSIKNETSTTIDQKVQDGVTTKDQVKAAFGDPTEVTFTDSGHELWKYSFTRTQENGTNFIPYYNAFSSGTHGRQKTLTIIYDDKGHVWHHTLSDSKVSTHQGIFR